VEKPFVLLADDNEATCTLVTALLHSDFVVETAADGNEAIEKLKARQYAAILLDLLMPGQDGFAVLEFLSRERPELLARVLVLTASLAPRDIDRVRQHAVRAIIAKPFDVEALLEAVRECSGSSSPPGAPFLAGGMLLMLAELLCRR
jgi:CheY-like chemotaxis protein